MLTPFATLIEELIELLGCATELRYLREIIIRIGTSAERLRKAFSEGGLEAVVDQLIAEFRET